MASHFDKARWQQESKALAEQLEAELMTSERIRVDPNLTNGGRLIKASLFGVFKENLSGKRSTSDGPATVDLLSRNAFAKYLSNRLRYVYQNNVKVAQGRSTSEEKGDGSNSNHVKGKSKYRSRAFLMLVDGEWGSGKTTLLGFLKNHLERFQPSISQSMDAALDKKDWIVVEFNAWQNQRLDAPWWFLMKTIHKTILDRYKIVNKKLKWKLWIKEIWWRINVGTNYLIFAVITLVLFIIAIIIGVRSEESLKALPAIQLFTFAGFLWSATKFFRTSLVDGSARSAKQFIDENSSDPMAVLSNHFRNQLESIDLPLAIFIDDLDRCNQTYAMKLLEGLQTIFMNAPVIYVVAADRRWLRTIYENEYNIFANVIAKPGKPFGLVFLDKTFQFIVELPAISDQQKITYWNYLLNISDEEKEVELSKLRQEADEKLKFVDSNAERETVLDKAGDRPIDRQIMREQIVSSIVIGEEQKILEDQLQKYIQLLEPNPRAMKRLLNDLSTARAMAFLYSNDVDDDQLILWTILRLQYPAVASFFWKAPDKLDLLHSNIESNTKIEIDKEYDSLFSNGELRQLLRFEIDHRLIKLDSNFLRKMKFEAHEKLRLNA